MSWTADVVCLLEEKVNDNLRLMHVDAICALKFCRFFTDGPFTKLGWPRQDIWRFEIHGGTARQHWHHLFLYSACESSMKMFARIATGTIPKKRTAVGWNGIQNEWSEPLLPYVVWVLSGHFKILTACRCAAPVIVKHLQLCWCQGSPWAGRICIQQTIAFAVQWCRGGEYQSWADRSLV